MENCVNCGAGIAHEPVVCHEGNDWCAICAEVNLFKSEVDDEYYPRSQRVLFNHTYMTEEQKEDIIDEQYYRCQHCDDLIHRELDCYHNINSNGYEETWCETCSDDNSFCCYSCDEQFNNDEMETDNRDNRYCNSCYHDETIECERCDVRLHQDDSYWRDDRCYCEGCQPSDRIHGYFYNPTKMFHFQDYENNNGIYYKKETAYLGVELEVDTPDDSASVVADECTLLHNENYTYLKEDSSINGFEIVTQPSTFETLRKEYKWREKLNQLQENGARGYDSGDCGIHVHITKRAYQPIVWWKAIKFMSKCESQVWRFSQRGDNNSYCKISDVYNYDNGAEFNFIKEYPRNSHTRYLALNFGDRQPTGEFRLFRSTTNHERFWASIEFAYGLMDFCVNHGYNFIRRSESDVVWREFMLHIKKLGYHTLYNHLIKRNIN